MPEVKVIKIDNKQPVKAITNEPKLKNVAAYARVSTDREEQSTSYEAQVTYYTNMIKSNPAWRFVNVYADEGITGTSIVKRNGFKEMIKDALAGKIDLIITKSVSRFARNTVDSLTTIRKLKEHGIEVYFEKENIWTFDGKGELLITIMSSLAQEESRSISENVKWGMRESMRRGKAWVPYKVFIGYDKGPDGNMVINEEEARLVRRIYLMYIQGMSPYRIAGILEAEKVMLPGGKAKWYPSTIKSILTNEKYKGDALRQKTYSKDFLTKERAKNSGEITQYYIINHHDPIIDPELFDRVQEEMISRKNAGEKNIGDRLFSRKIRCGDCGGFYGPVTWATHTAHEKEVWRCNKKYAPGKPNCIPPAITEEELKRAFVKGINLAIRDKELLISKIIIILKDVLLRAADTSEKCYDSFRERIIAIYRRLDEINQCEKLVSEFDYSLFLNLAEYMTVCSHDDIKVTLKDGLPVKD